MPTSESPTVPVRAPSSVTRIVRVEPFVVLLSEHYGRNPYAAPTGWQVVVRHDGQTVARHELSSWTSARTVFEAAVAAVSK